MLRSIMAGLVLAIAGSRANVARTILSCAGIIVGIGALISVVTASHVGERFAVSYSESNYGRAATFQLDLHFTPTDVGAFETDLRRSGAQAVSMTSPVDGVFLRVGSEVMPDIDMTLTDPELAVIRKLEMVRGRWFTEDDQLSLAPVMVVNESLAALLGDGTTIQVGSEQWLDVRVVGVLENSGLDPSWHSAYLLRGPVSESLIPLPHPDFGPRMAYSVLVDPDSADPETYTERLNSAAWHWNPQHADRNSSVSAWRVDETEQLEELIGVFSLGLLGIAAITLTTGLLGVLNVGLVTVRERRRELATYRALGANSFTLFIAVVTEAIVVSVVAGAIALAFCYLGAAGADLFAAPYLPSDVSIFVPPEAALVGLSSAAFVGLLAGVIPAWRALRASVVAGLRE